MNSTIKIGFIFDHRRVLNEDYKTPMKYRVTRIANGWVYYKPLISGQSEKCPVEDFYSKVVK